jgi:plastocyanin
MPDIRLRLGRLGLGALMGGALLAGAAPMPALAHDPVVYTIGVDNAGPAGHIFEYVDFFPRQGVKVGPGDVLDFKWNGASQDGAHTVTFVPKGTGLFPLAVPQPSGDEPGLQFNPDILFPTNPTCGSGASNPCVFDGSQAVNSGFIFDANPTPPYASDFFVSLDAKLLQGGSTMDIPYFCEVHPGMTGVVTLVSDPLGASRVFDVQAAAAQQLVDDTAGALTVERSANTSFSTRNTDGTSNVLVTAGTATQYVEIAEMLPSTVTIKPGDMVTWVTKAIKDPHTVTFPRGRGSDAVDPLLPFCEAQPSDTPPSENGPPCPNPANFEIRLVPQPQGAAAISSATTVGTSGLIGAGPFPAQFSFSFPNAGSFDYQCRIHEHMVGLVIAK